MSPVVHTSSGEEPADPAGLAVAESVADLLGYGRVALHYTPFEEDPPATEGTSATVPGPVGWWITLAIDLPTGATGVRPNDDDLPLPAVLAALPRAALRAATQLRPGLDDGARLTPALRRALRDTVVVELFAELLGPTSHGRSSAQLLAEVLEFLIELSGTRVESHDLTHGVVITDAIADEPRIELDYPGDLVPAKRSPLLFDGQESVLVVDRSGRARTELQRHRLSRLMPDRKRMRLDEERFVDSGSLVALATRQLGGIGFFLRADRSIWAFAEGGPLFVRRGEHWTAFPLELAGALEQRVGATPAINLVVQTAFTISGQKAGAILAVVDDPADVEGLVAPKDRWDLRNDADPTAARPETRLHHLIDAEALDHHTLARLARLDGATLVDRTGKLVAYGAIVASDESRHEGARTAAARTLAQVAPVVLKVSEDGEITVFREGKEINTLLRSGPPA